MPHSSFISRLGLLIAASVAFNPVPISAENPRASELNNRAVTQARAGNFEAAIDGLKQALQLNPSDALAQKNLSGILTDYAKQQEKQASVSQLIQWLEEAAALDGKNGLAWAQLGDLYYYGKNDASAAVPAWQKAIPSISSSAARILAARIVQVQRDQTIERGYEAVNTEHFVIKVEGGRALDLNELGLMLEKAFAQLKGELGSGPESLTVIVYTGQALKRVSGQRDWTIGLYDGRLRLRVDELTAALLPDLVIHELAHAFLHRLYGYALPVWVHEGYAQSHESEIAAALRSHAAEASLRSRSGWIPLKWLDRRFQQPSNNEDLLRAYAQSRIAVERLIARYGIQAFAQFARSLSQGKPIDEAFNAHFAPWRWSKFEQGIVD